MTLTVFWKSDSLAAQKTFFILEKQILSVWYYGDDKRDTAEGGRGNEKEEKGGEKRRGNIHRV